MRRIFALYLHGDQGVAIGFESIAYFLDERGITRRGRRWMRFQVHEVLANPAYAASAYFNRSDGKTRKLKPPTEWVKLTVEPIIDLALFRRVQLRRGARAPAAVAPRVVSSPTLLTGLLEVRRLRRRHDLGHWQRRALSATTSAIPASARGSTTVRARTCRCGSFDPAAQYLRRSHYHGARCGSCWKRWHGMPRRAASNNNGSWQR